MPVSRESERIPGAAYVGEGRCRFVMWAPEYARVEVRFLTPRERVVALEPSGRGYHVGLVEGVEPGARYRMWIKGLGERPDPASRFQPEGVHGPSEVIDPRFEWQDAGWNGRPLDQYVAYELHVGAFTPEGTFDAAIVHLDGLKELGITAVELMPVTQFPGERNWGYDGAYSFAVQNSYGGPAGLKRFVNACHQRGIAVILDVVYNHLGPEGNYLWGTGPYFTDRYRTPWGPAVNFDGPGSDEVRNYFIQNALYWVRDFHIDALRLDAVHAIVDVSARPFLEELADRIHREAKDLNRRVFLIAESDRNDPRLVRPVPHGGLGLDAVWNDDFHHTLHVLLTGEKQGYYRDFGTVEQLGRALTEGFVYSGQYSTFRERRHGASPRQVGADQLVIFAQNHDQVGNRMLGERLSTLVNFEKLKLAAGVLLLSPNIPLLFMGEEYAEASPFHYFVSHGDPGLIEAVRNGRKEEFKKFSWKGEPPDPQDEATFRRSKLNRSLLEQAPNRAFRDLVKSLLELRREQAPLARLSKDDTSVSVYGAEMVILSRRFEEISEVFTLFNFSEGDSSIVLPSRGGTWRKRFDSAEAQWHGPGSSVPEEVNLDAPPTLVLNPSSFVLFTSPRGGAETRLRIAREALPVGRSGPAS